MAIQFLDITNFQKHEKLRVDFDPGITTIIGVSDAGKSSILRAVRWVCQNQPAGDYFIRQGSDGAVCVLGVDGKTITRRRMTNGENKYFLDDAEFVSFNLSVPDRIQKVLCTDTICFVGQKEPDFWFASTPLEVARQLNAVVDLGIIDQSLENIGRKVRQCQEGVRFAQTQLAAANQKKDALAWVGDAEAGMGAVASLWDKADSLGGALAALDHVLSGVRASKANVAKAQTKYQDTVVVGKVAAKCLKLRENSESLAGVLSDIEAKQKQQKYTGVDISRLDVAFRQYETTKKQADGLAMLLTKVAGNTARRGSFPVEAAACFGRMSAAVQRVGDFRRLAGVLSSALARVADASDKARVCAERLKQAEAALAGVTVDRCPTCERPF